MPNLEGAREDMSCEIDADYGNMPDAFKERHRTARKQHMCCERQQQANTNNKTRTIGATNEH